MSTIMPFKGEEFELCLTWEGDTFEVRGPELAQSLGFREAYDMVRALPDDEKVLRNESGHTPSELSRTPDNQQVWYVTEAGFYRALGQRQPERIKDASIRESVVRFQNWIYREVLPQIRRTGTYAAPEAPAVEAATPNSYLGSTLSIREVENWAMLSAEADRLCQHTQEHHAFLTSLIALHRLGHVETNDVNRALTELTAAAEVYAAMIRSTAMRRAGIGPWRVTSQRFR